MTHEGINITPPVPGITTSLPSVPEGESRPPPPSGVPEPLGAATPPSPTIGDAAGPPLSRQPPPVWPGNELPHGRWTALRDGVLHDVYDAPIWLLRPRLWEEAGRAVSRTAEARAARTEPHRQSPKNEPERKSDSVTKPLDEAGTTRALPRTGTAAALDDFDEAYADVQALFAEQALAGDVSTEELIARHIADLDEQVTLFRKQLGLILALPDTGLPAPSATVTTDTGRDLRNALRAARQHDEFLRPHDEWRTLAGVLQSSRNIMRSAGEVLRLSAPVTADDPRWRHFTNVMARHTCTAIAKSSLELARAFTRDGQRESRVASVLRKITHAAVNHRDRLARDPDPASPGAAAISTEARALREALAADPAGSEMRPGVSATGKAAGTSLIHPSVPAPVPVPHPGEATRPGIQR